ncbi:MAG: 5-formyltetrahydrofolate cyclo-ligase [Pseudomonadota bacterium]
MSSPSIIVDSIASSHSPAVSRSELRKLMRARRAALSETERDEAALSVAERIAATNWFRRSRHIACYLPQNGELDPTPLMQRAWAMGKICYLPVLNTLHANRMWFVPYSAGDKLIPNRYGIPEPITSRHRLSAHKLDLVLTPLVAFDAQGNRLGQGGGFYDQTFAFLRHRRHWRKPRLIGIAYEFQRVARLQNHDWDVPLYAVATETTLYFPGKETP